MASKDYSCSEWPTIRARRLPKAAIAVKTLRLGARHHPHSDVAACGPNLLTSVCTSKWEEPTRIIIGYWSSSVTCSSLCDSWGRSIVKRLSATVKMTCLKLGHCCSHAVNYYLLFLANFIKTELRQTYKIFLPVCTIPFVYLPSCFIVTQSKI